MTDFVNEPTTGEEITYCAVHPDRETGLRCNKCGRYMCAQCAVQTPVGYRCRECVRQHDDKFFNATQNDYILLFAVSAGLTGLVAVVMSAIRLPLLFIILLGLPIGGAISEAVVRAVKKRRGRQSGIIAASGAVIGGLVGAGLQTYLTLQGRISEAAAARGIENVPAIPLDAVFNSLLSNWSLLILIAIVAFAVYSRFKMRI
ncbi:MAG: hypothetical protein K8L99_26315 [Anaerolineae bacterium]|nr:hypothetical protein [Anaerolineae bacterium]